MAMNFGTLDFAVAFQRQTAFPLDARSYFETLSAAQTAAATAQEAGSSETVYYFGQTIAVVENGAATLYVIQPDKTLKEVGGNIAINENIFSKTDNGSLDLIGFVDAVAGAQAVKGADGKIKWVKPDTTTVEGLSTAVSALQEAVGDETKGLTKRVTDNETAIAKLNGNDKTEGSVAYQIAQIVAGAPEAYNTLKEIATWITTHSSDASAMNQQIETNKTDIASLSALVGNTAVATQIANAIDAALKSGETDKYALAADLTALSTRVTNLEAKVGDKSVAEQITSALQTEDGKDKYAPASHVHEISNINGLSTVLNAKATASDVEALQTTVNTLTAASHTHDNKTALDVISEQSVNEWNAAQPNVIEVLKLNGVVAPVSADDKSVNIPAATTSSLGLAQADGVTIEAVNGVFSVKTVDVSKLSVADGSELILDGGHA